MGLDSSRKPIAVYIFNESKFSRKVAKKENNDIVVTRLGMAINVKKTTSLLGTFLGALSIANIGRIDAILVYLLTSLDSYLHYSGYSCAALEHYSGYSYILLFDSNQNECGRFYSITLHRALFVLGRCDVLEQDRTVESSTPYA